ncbi:MAG: PEFG-CTERM sorting domain-containing protein [Thaumarchaeota archaeon]|nr:MAG: PEFG-CTERM sorting domain-containing protein [Nitrososphaerota archaeon]
MKSKTIGSFFVVLTLVVGIMAFAPSAFADTAVSITKGSGASASAACVSTNNCFTPNPVNVSPGDTVTWTNTDTASHTVTSGKIDNSTGNIVAAVFDSSLLTPGKTFSHQFTAADVGTINYFCQVHPWMTGVVTVAAGGAKSGGMNTGGAMTMVQGMSTDGSTQVTIDTTPAAPVSGQPLSIALTFKNANGNPIKHQNYAITVTQDGNSVLSNTTGHTHTGNDMQMTSNLEYAKPVDITVTLNGVGLPGTDPSTWTGPKGDVVSFHVVPEFGSIASIVLAIAVISVVVFTTKTRVILKL